MPKLEETETDAPAAKAEDGLKNHIKDIKTRKLLRARGIKKLFPIQEQTFQPIYEGKDLIGQDRTGSGKTLAYCLPLSERLRAEGLYDEKSKPRLPRVLVLLPTRELAI